MFLDHLEQHVQHLHCLAVAMVTERKEAALSEQELQLQQLKPEHIQTHIYQPRLGNTHTLTHRLPVQFWFRPFSSGSVHSIV